MRGRHTIQPQVKTRLNTIYLLIDSTSAKNSTLQMTQDIQRYLIIYCWHTKLCLPLDQLLFELQFYCIHMARQYIKFSFLFQYKCCLTYENLIIIRMLNTAYNVSYKLLASLHMLPNYMALEKDKIQSFCSSFIYQTTIFALNIAQRTSMP